MLAVTGSFAVYYPRNLYASGHTLKNKSPQMSYELMDSFCHKYAGMLTLLLLLKIDGDFLTYLNTTWRSGMKPQKVTVLNNSNNKNLSLYVT